MATKIAFLLFGLLCLAPIITASSKSSEESGETAPRTKAFSDRMKLLASTLSEFSSLHDEIIEKGPNVFAKVLEDPKVLEVRTKAMEKQKDRLKDFIEKINKIPGPERKEETFELADDFMDIVEKFNSEKHTLTPEAAIIEKSLNENGLESFRNSAKTHFEKFMAQFGNKIETYFNGLNKEEREKEKNLLEWYNKIKNENDTEKKIEMFDQFFNSGEDDD